MGGREATDKSGGVVLSKDIIYKGRTKGAINAMACGPGQWRRARTSLLGDFPLIPALDVFRCLQTLKIINREIIRIDLPEK